ncbi:Pectinesterase inhibitor domain - like 10 [Theobroma cacao]|nr:Pectinesterase inhibitor domain - like 10 [Theobroma cacao]
MIRLHFVLFSCYILSPSFAATSSSPTKLVDKVCNQTSNYTFCVEALDSDPRTPAADAYQLAYLNATATQYRIAELLNDNNTSIFANMITT